MTRFNKIKSVRFGPQNIALTTKIRFIKAGEFDISKSDNTLLPKHFNTTDVSNIIEISSRDINAFNAVNPGNISDLEIKVCSGNSESKLITYVVRSCIASKIETSFSQKDFAITKGTFFCISTNGFTNPIEVESNG